MKAGGARAPHALRRSGPSWPVSARRYAVERWLRALPYNFEKGGETLRSFRRVVRDRTAHCLEAALFAAAALEPHGFPPWLMSLESQDNLDHVIFVFRENGRYGAVGRSRDPGLHGRKPVFPTLRSLALSYRDPFVTRRAAWWASAGPTCASWATYDWRFAEKNVWKVERWLIDYPHHRVRMAEGRYRSVAREVPPLHRALSAQARLLRGQGPVAVATAAGADRRLIASHLDMKK